MAAAAAIVLLWVGLSMAQSTGVDLPSADLPPESDPSDCGVLVSHYWGLPSSYEGLATLGSLSLKCFQGVVREAVGNDELQTYSSMLVTNVDLGTGPVSTTFTGPMQTLVTDRNLSTTGLFDAEIVSMSLSGDAGGMPLVLREAPSLISSGQIDITDLGGGLYHIDSFFDVYTELSVDGGQTWVPVDAAQRLTLYGIDVPVGLQSFNVE